MMMRLPRGSPQAEYAFWNDDDDAPIAVSVRNLFDQRHLEGGTFYCSDSELPQLLLTEPRPLGSGFFGPLPNGRGSDEMQTA